MQESIVTGFAPTLITASKVAQKVISDDTIMDAAERDVGDKAIVTIAKRQPMAADLRVAGSSAKFGVTPGSLRRVQTEPS